MAKCSLLALVMMVLLASLNIGYCYTLLGTCTPSGYLTGRRGGCNRENDSDCCVAGKKYPQYYCSPPVTGHSTKAHMTINSFEESGDILYTCDAKYHSNNEMIVALSTGWFNRGSRCLKNIRINANGRSVLAKVVDDCDSMYGCDADHDNQPPCPNNIVDASSAVWKALKIPKSKIGDFYITWSDA